MEPKYIKFLLDAIPTLRIQGAEDTEITGICSHSKQIAPGNLFVVRRGKRYDGSQFIQQAIQAGATAILTERYHSSFSIAQLIHPDISWAEEQCVLHYYGFPSKALRVIGITGTNGKTTTSYLIKHLLDAAGISCGLIGTIESIIGGHHFPSSLTTPDFATNQKTLFAMKQASHQAVVMEVSSHALVQERVRGIDFSAALFTNLTREHLDYHQTMEEYAAAKRRLFTSLSPEGKSIINVDDPHASFFYSPTSITYGMHNAAFLKASDIVLTENETIFTACTADQTARIESQLIGRFNIYNILSALTVGLSFGISLEESARHLRFFSLVPGRLSRVPNDLGVHIFIDYAHTPSALENVLLTLRELKRGQLITVFGCGGERDQGKRPEMGRIAEELSDSVIVTNDNPRGEDPLSIALEIAQGMKETAHIELNRHVSIEKAIKMAQRGDIVLIAGKGHEKVQIFANQILPFDDWAVAHEIASHLREQRRM